MPEDILDSRVIEVGADFGYPPYSYNQNGELVGSEVDLVKAVADELGIDAQFTQLAYETMIPSVANGRMHMLLGPFQSLPERYEQVTMIEIFRMQMQAVVKKGNPSEFNADDPCGAMAGEGAGSINMWTVEDLSEQCVAAGEPAIEILPLAENANAYQSVLSERTDFTMQQTPAALHMVETSDDFELNGDPIPAPAGDLQGWIVQKGNDKLVESLIWAVEQLIESGEWREIMERHGLWGSALPGPLVNTEAPR
ncbi:transporter substrate-binding domain-containing protein [Dietzia lutea]|uniref:transporter substrate-binding domain-containing protein n=1 Tax=Dietzia lutea TaxID=546160 RepID=UPI0013304E40|nr:transporter substrate-binding domain-containing protein [Dietzia lutea]